MRKPDDWYELSFVVTAEKDGDLAYVASDWNEGIRPWDFGSSYALWEATDILRGSVFTDRGVYKPGEDVHVKAIIRADTPTGVRLLPAGSPLDIKVTDNRNREVDRRRVTVNRWSSAEWTWTVPAGGTLGNYTIEASVPGSQPVEGADRNEGRSTGEWLKQVRGSFLVAAYRRPDFRVDATLSAATPIAGTTLRGAVEARYLFGGAMNARPVRWSVVRERELSIPAAIRERYPEGQFTFGYYPDDGADWRADRIAGETGPLDRDGKLTTDVASTRDRDFAHRYTFEGDVEDVSRQHVAGRASIVVHPAPWYIGLRRPDYFASTATGTSVDVVAADLQGNAVSGLPITLTLTRIQWNSVRRAEGGGFYTWDTEELRVPAGEWRVTSAATPTRVPIPVPEGGYYVLTATARRHGRPPHAHRDSSFYGLGKGYTAWQRYDHNRITLEPEKKTWKPGETARVMIQSPWETATALLTVEREGIRRHERFTLTSTQQTDRSARSRRRTSPTSSCPCCWCVGGRRTDPGTDGSRPGQARLPPRLRGAGGRRRDQAAGREGRPPTGPSTGRPTPHACRSTWPTRRAARSRAKSRSGPWTTACSSLDELSRARRAQGRVPGQGAAGDERRQPPAHRRADASSRRRATARAAAVAPTARAMPTRLPATGVLARLGRDRREPGAPRAT